MNIVYRLERASVSEARAELPDPPSYSAVRAVMGTLVEKGHLKQEQDGRRYLYTTTVPAEKASVSALRRVVTNFFGGSPGLAALALVLESKLDPEELEALETAIAKAREAGR